MTKEWLRLQADYDHIQKLRRLDGTQALPGRGSAAASSILLPCTGTQWTSVIITETIVGRGLDTKECKRRTKSHGRITCGKRHSAAPNNISASHRLQAKCPRAVIRYQGGGAPPHKYKQRNTQSAPSARNNRAWRMWRKGHYEEWDQYTRTLQLDAPPQEIIPLITHSCVRRRILLLNIHKTSLLLILWD
jgi:hypothetical protein